MDKLYYPAVMHPEQEGGYSVWLTDIDGCISQGETLSEAVENIKDALGLFYEDAVEGFSVLPAPSSPNSVELEESEVIAVIEFSPTEYLKNKSTKAVNLNNPLEIREIGLNALQDALGPVGMTRFIQQFDLGQGDYTKERQTEKDITIDEFEEILKRGTK